MFTTAKSKFRKHLSMSATASSSESTLVQPKNRTLGQVFRLGQTPMCEAAFGTAVEVIMMLNSLENDKSNKPACVDLLKTIETYTEHVNSYILPITLEDANAWSAKAVVDEYEKNLTTVRSTIEKSRPRRIRARLLSQSSIRNDLKQCNRDLSVVSQTFKDRIASESASLTSPKLASDPTSHSQSLSLPHAALCIPEIQYQIFDHAIFGYVDESHERRVFRRYGPQKDLVSLAIACRTFRDVALSVLWRDLYGIEALLDVWRGKPNAVLAYHEPDGYKFLRRPNEAEWARFTYYAALIQTLEVKCTAFSMYHMSGSPLFDVGFFQALDDAITPHRSLVDPQTGRPVLFPRLTWLDWRCDNLDDVLGCESFVWGAPRLNGLAFAPPEEGGDDLYSAWSSLPDTLRQLEIPLKQLTLLGDFSAIEDAKPFADFIHGSQVQELTLTSSIFKSPAVMSALSSVPTLERLKLARRRGRPIAHDYDPVRLAPALEVFDRLQVFQGDLRSIRIMLLTVPNLPNLVELSNDNKNMGERATWNIVREVLDLAGSRCPKLQRLDLRAVMIDKTRDFHLNDFALLSLASCSALNHIIIRFSSPPNAPRHPVPIDFNPSDSEWLQLAHAWPNIQHIEYSCGPHTGQYDSPYILPFNPLPRATFRAISLLLQQAKELQVLCVPVHAMRQDGCELVCSSQSLREIRFGQSWIDWDAVEEVGDALHRLKAWSKETQFLFTQREGGLKDFADALPFSITDEESRGKAWHRVECLSDGKTPVLDGVEVENDAEESESDNDGMDDEALQDQVRAAIGLNE